MHNNTSIPIPHRILLGVTFFVFLASFSATGVLMVLKTNQKAASKDDSVPKEAVVEIFNPDTKKELSAELTNKEESIASQPAKKQDWASASTTTPQPQPSTTRTPSYALPESSPAPSERIPSQPGNTLVFDDSPEGDSLVFDATLFQEKEAPRLDQPLQPDGGIFKAENPTKNASVGNGSHTPKGSLHEMALLSKDPTVTIGLDPSSTGIIVGREGSRIKIPAGSLVFEDGTPCNTPYDAKIWEFYDFADILLSGLTTMSDQGPLQTGGMTYLEVKSQGRKLSLAEGSQAAVSFAPFYETNSDFGLYDGSNEDGQILWRKVEQKDEVPTLDRSRISVSKFPESLGKLSKFGKVACLMNQDSFTNDTLFFGSQMKDRSFEGEKLIRFPNGTAMLFEGNLEITKAAQKTSSSSSSSELEARFEGKSLMVLVPPSSNELSAFDSEMKIFLPEEGFPVPFISTVNTDKTTLFSYRKGKTTDIEALHGDVNFLSTKKQMSLSGQSYSYEKLLKRGTRAQAVAWGIGAATIFPPWIT